MHGDPKFSKFFLYLNLFVFSMMVLVLGENMLVTFLGWEGVGTCSYLLIAFWHTRESAATAGKKAFVTNRVGDWGFMLAMFLTFSAVGSLSFSVLNNNAESSLLSQTTATGIAALLFIGAVGKSAQLPLYLWLPDAMDGPTPVSALIHAATMVTAGVYLMARVNPVLTVAADWVGPTIAWVGVITAFLAATIALAQTDIKTRARLLDDLPARLHVPRHRYRRLCRRRLPHDHPRLLQGAAVPRIRLGHPRHARRAGHAQDGPTGEVHADHGRRLHRRLAGDRGRAAVRRVLVEGRNHAVRRCRQHGAVRGRVRRPRC